MAHRITLGVDPNLDTTRYGFFGTSWPAAWIGPQTYDPRESYVYLFRRRFAVAKPARFRLHISADQRYELCIDEQLIGRGPERGDLKAWPYDSYQLSLEPGRHMVTVRLYWVSPVAPAPEAQQTHGPGLIVYAEGAEGAEGQDQLSTGKAAWQYQHLAAYRFADHDRLWCYFATGAQLNIDGRQIDASVEAGRGDGWMEVRRLSGASLAAQRWESSPHWILRPASLPAAHAKELRLGRARHVEAVAGEDTEKLAIDAQSHLAGEGASWN
jgi:hypothetical protein